MLLADKKRKNNISEYIIFMYQTEDLLRVYQFDMEEIETYVISHFPVDAKEKATMKQWYAEVAESMHLAGIEERGHLPVVQAIVEDLFQLSIKLQQEDLAYQKVYTRALPYITESMEMGSGQIKNPIQACLNGIYGLLLLRMNGKAVDPSLMGGINAFGDVLSYLSYQYKMQ